MIIRNSAISKLKGKGWSPSEKRCVHFSTGQLTLPEKCRPASEGSKGEEQSPRRLAERRNLGVREGLLCSPLPKSTADECKASMDRLKPAQSIFTAFSKSVGFSLWKKKPTHTSIA